MKDFVKKKRGNRENALKLGFSENNTFINNFIAQKKRVVLRSRAVH